MDLEKRPEVDLENTLGVEFVKYTRSGFGKYTRSGFGKYTVSTTLGGFGSNCTSGLCFLAIVLLTSRIWNELTNYQ
jgi:hypothetical protein